MGWGIPRSLLGNSDIGNSKSKYKKLRRERGQEGHCGQPWCKMGHLWYRVGLQWFPEFRCN